MTSSVRLDSPFSRDIAAADGPEPTLTWISFPEGAGPERLMAWTGGDQPPRSLLEAEALGRPALCRIGDRVVAACSALRDDRWSMEIFDSSGSRPRVSIPLENDAPGQVSICPTGDDLLLCWEHRLGRDLGLRLARLSSELRLHHDIEAVPGRGSCSEPRLVWDGEHAWLGWLESRWTAGPWRLELARVDRLRAPVELSERGRFRVGELSLSASRPGRLWAAWHTDRRPGGEADLTRWVETRLVTGGRVVRLGVPQPWARWGRLGEDQGLEFPSIVASPGGAVALLAKSSHRWWGFQLTAEGWSRPAALDDEGWGCRSRRVALLRLDDGRLLWARRSKGAVELVELQGPWLKARPCVRVEKAAIHKAPQTKGFTSRPSARPRLGGYQICFGDIHQHTAHSDGTGTAREAYERARDHYRDDLVSVTDHESFLGKRIGPGEWRSLMATCDLFDEPGRFVTLPGYEWTGRRHPGPGHRCVYLPDTSLELLGREHPRARSSAELIEAVGRAGGLVFPHHVGWTGADAEVHDPRVQTCWEIVSCHGAYEALGVGPIGQRDTPLEGHFIRDQLEAGLRFGFVGGSDGHGLLWHHGIAHRRDSHRTGLTAVLVEELSRAAVFEALRARRCYATSGLPLMLDLRIAGRPMGAELTLRERAALEASAEGMSELRRAELVWSRGEITPLEARGSSLRARLEIEPPPAGGSTYVYLRVEQRDGEVAWSSPIWLENR